MKKRDLTKAIAGYLGNLNPGDADKTYLRKARGLVRAHLRKCMPDIQLRFMTQGSYRYGTLNLPCYPPQQQMDLDDGMYAPRSVVDKTGLSGAQLLAQVAEHLRPLASAQSWSAPQAKHSCVRIRIDEDKHVDIPFYRTADSELKDISDHTSSSGGGKHTEIYREWGVLGYFDAAVVVELATDQGWKPSDSRKIIEWVADCRAEHGARFIRISRILKGWRDYQWQQKSPLSSILIMAMVEAAMKEVCLSVNSSESDDMALWDVVNVIAEKIVHQDIKDPDGESLNAKWTQAERDDCHHRFVALANTLKAVLGGDGDGDGDIKKLREQFGRFFPNDSSLIKKCATKAAAVASITAPSAAKAGHYASAEAPKFSVRKGK